jgi:hypothetical protein
VPSSESEYALFDVYMDLMEPPLHPRGGHNYYNGRDMEMTYRRMQYLDKILAGEESWEVRYRNYIKELSH